MSTRPAVPADRRPVTIPSLFEMKRAGTPIVMVTAYDYPSARAAEAADVDMVLVGDSGRDDGARPLQHRRGDHRRDAGADQGRPPRRPTRAAGRGPAVRLLRGQRRAGDRHRDPVRQGSRRGRGQTGTGRRQLDQPGQGHRRRRGTRSSVTSGSPRSRPPRSVDTGRRAGPRTRRCGSPAARSACRRPAASASSSRPSRPR